MNPNPLFTRQPRWLLPAVLALLMGGATWVVAESKGDEPSAHRSVDVKVDTTPLPREADSTYSFSPIVKRVIPSVVKVVTMERAKEMEVEGGSPFDDPAFRQFFGPFFGAPNTGRRIIRQPPQIGLGSGVIVSSDGYILTNNHVVDGADTVRVTLADKRVLTAKVVGTDKKTDVAVIKVDAKDLPALTFADSSGVQVGDRVLAVGNPFGLSETVTSGIVSGLGRGMPGNNGQSFNYQDYIQTDAAINPGNSGGALVDMQGRLIGINTAIYSRDGGFQGIGFAIPSNLARSIMDSLVKNGRVVRGYLGVTIQDLSPDVAEQFQLKSDRGAIVTDVSPDSPAAKAGLKGDDVILDFNGKPVTDSRSLSFAVADTTPGREATVRILRDGKEENLQVKIGEQPGDQQLASASATKGDNSVLNGVEVTDLDAASRNEFDVPPRVHGALVTDVDPTSASAEAGLSAGDVIMEINHQPVRSADDAVRLTEHAASRKTLLKLWSRDGIHFLVVDETNDKSS
jgi:Do/DeqQ family serine protease